MQTWICRGVTGGGLLATAEILFATVSGLNLPISYIMAVFVFDLLVGLLLGVTIAGMARYLDEERSHSYAFSFVVLAAGTLLIFLSDKAVLAARNREIPGTLGMVLLTLCLILGTPMAYRSLARLSTTSNPELSLFLSLLSLHVFLVGSHFFTRSLFGSYMSLGGLAVNILGTLLLLGILLLIDRLLHVPAPPRLNFRASQMSVLATSLALAVTMLGWASQTTREPISRSTRNRGRQPGPPVVLISIDTLRPDHLSAYGYQRETSPVLETFARESVLFKDAISSSTWTLPAHASILTGTFPRKHSAHRAPPKKNSAQQTGPSDASARYPTSNATAGLHTDNLTLAEILSEAGYQTAGVVANSGYLNRSFGFSQGFDFYDDRARVYLGYRPVFDSLFRFFPLAYYPLARPYRTAESINLVAFQWLEETAKAPLFLFLNYMEPHDPYWPPVRVKGRYAASPPYYTSLQTEFLTAEKLSTTQRDLLVDLYDGEIAYLDHEIGRLFDKLKQLRLYDDALIIVTSDHGEFFGAHGLWNHGVGPYEQVHRVPLIIKYPRSEITGIEEARVQTVDILPTVLTVAQIPIPTQVQGSPLPHVTHPIIAEQYPNSYVGERFGEHFGQGYRSIYEDEWKLVLYFDAAVELYNLTNDPFEATDASTQRPDLVQSMRAHLESYVASMKPIAPDTDPKAPLDDETRRTLRALGYIQ